MSSFLLKFLNKKPMPVHAPYWSNTAVIMWLPRLPKHQSEDLREVGKMSYWAHLTETEIPGTMGFPRIIFEKQINRNCSFSKSSLPVIKRLLGNKSGGNTNSSALRVQGWEGFWDLLTQILPPTWIVVPWCPFACMCMENSGFYLFRPNNHSSLSWHLSQLFLTVMHVLSLKGECRSRIWDISFGWVMWLRIWRRMYTGYLLFLNYTRLNLILKVNSYFWRATYF